MNSGVNILEFFKDVYLVDSGSFSINLILQAVGFNILLDLNRFQDLLDSYFSPTTA